ncbi:cell division topological specificity factor MinE [Rhodoferax antarcticus]|uniref:Cell division topological specificity factor n=1 Tax=Rhodoferax antarcticus ANT.BR TaxID=1111071 RepID=A0A1Q8YHJ6_9BURK|nr:cell division topological specificity factor MinE [Rhodoferax antarcticus]APW45222.1 cell division topological specificity factor MinE [Rhodoferax antarcticus]MCW2310972.1 cell division topological specificity factor [Rhodoferax antarcticus]OLP07483.1 cell division topological specificity factor [Rhodoferax antarcticus ANT.BR]
MSFFSFFLGEKTKTASVAKERLQIILAHERSGRSPATPDYLPDLQRELIAVISKYVNINPDDIKVNLERQDNLEVLEVKIELPDKR